MSEDYAALTSTQLQDILFDPKPPPIQQQNEIIQQLGRDGSEAAIALLGKVLLEAPADEVRPIALSQLEKMLNQLYEGEPGYTRKLFALIQPLQAALNSDVTKPFIRNSVQLTLATAVVRLISLLENSPPEQKEKVRQQLARIGTDNLSNILDAVPDDSREKSNVATALVEVDPEQAADPLLATLKNTDNPDLIVAILPLLSRTQTPKVIADIATFLREDPVENVRRAAAESLRRLQFPASLPPLAQALLTESSNLVRRAIIRALAAQEKWEDRAAAIIRQLDNGEQERNEIAAPQLIMAINAPVGTDGVAVGLLNYLFDQTLNFTRGQRTFPFIWQKTADFRMVAIMADLMLAAVGGNVTLADVHLNEYKKDKKILETELSLLRTELNPVLRALQYNLEANFQQPVIALNEETRQMWAATIRQARYGFIIRVLMSVITFGVGIGLVYYSARAVLINDLPSSDLWGPGTTFAAGIITMLLTVYKGPLNDIRRSVNDLGIASAAFIAYIHRVLQISHTFYYHYLSQTIDFDNLKQTSDLMQEAMASTIQHLQEPAQEEDDY